MNQEWSSRVVFVLLTASLAVEVGCAGLGDSSGFLGRPFSFDAYEAWLDHASLGQP